MSVFKCKICGAELNVQVGDKIVKCEYCGTSQTVPISQDEKILKLYTRGTSLRASGEFDKAYSIFEQIIAEGEPEAESYWNLLLCKYGIIYVDDYNGKKIPTINRLSMTSILDDKDYHKTLELADPTSQQTYIEQANTIAKIQTKIIKIVNNEKPYDIFISYKETDEFGDRTRDSLLAQDIYNSLTKEGYRIFLSRVSLSNVAGQEYEPYIYSALYSSKIMLLVTTDIDYLNSTWIKNEWSRFVSLMSSNPDKKIIPCYQNIDPYDMPKELRNIQGLDMSHLGFIQDLTIGVNKIMGKTKSSSSVVSPTNGNISSLIKRARLALEDKEYEIANDIIDKALDLDPECADAYALQLLCDKKTTLDQLQLKPVLLENNKNYQKILRFGNDEIINTYKSINDKYKDDKYCFAMASVNKIGSSNNPIPQLITATQVLKKIGDYKNSLTLLTACNDKVVELTKALKQQPVLTYKLTKDLGQSIFAQTVVLTYLYVDTPNGQMSYWNINYIKVSRSKKTGAFMAEINGKETKSNEVKTVSICCDYAELQILASLLTQIKKRCLLALNKDAKFYGDIFNYKPTYDITKYNFSVISLETLKTLKKLLRDFIIELTFSVSFVIISIILFAKAAYIEYAVIFLVGLPLLIAAIPLFIVSIKNLVRYLNYKKAQAKK